LKVRPLKTEFTEAGLKDIVNEFLTILTKLSFDDNFNASIKEVVLPASASVPVEHSIQVAPKYRIILRQTGNATITDGTFDEKTATLVNNAAVEVRLTVMFLRG